MGGGLELGLGCRRCEAGWERRPGRRGVMGGEVCGRRRGLGGAGVSHQEEEAAEQQQRGQDRDGDLDEALRVELGRRELELHLGGLHAVDELDCVKGLVRVRVTVRVRVRVGLGFGSG